MFPSTSNACVFVCNCICFVLLLQPYFQKTKTPQSLLIRLKMRYPFPTLQSQQQLKSPWWAARREKQGKPRSHTLSGQQTAGCHQQEGLWVRKGSAQTERTRASKGPSWPQWPESDSKPTVDPPQKVGLLSGFSLWVSLRTGFLQTSKHTCFGFCVKIIGLFPRAYPKLLGRKGSFQHCQLPCLSQLA